MNHEQYMQRCLQLAKLGAGIVAPNPMVGALIVLDGKIIGEGWHQEFGKAHAEVNAINDVKDQTVLSQSTLYVNLEPCSHHGKTPPCVDLILAHKIPKVIIGITDPFAKVNGEGIKKLRANNVEVITPVLENQCAELNKRFFTVHQRKRPYIILKWAQSKDGFIGKKDKRILISNKLSQIRVHRWRSEEHAIMVGTKTALIDNPELTVREYFGRSQIRIVVDKNLRLPPHLHLFDNSQLTFVFTSKEKANSEKIKYLTLEENNFSVKAMMTELHTQNIQSVLVEGGTQLIQSFFDTGCWDEARVITGNIFLNDGVSAPILAASSLSKKKSGDDLIQYFKNKNAF